MVDELTEDQKNEFKDVFSLFDKVAEVFNTMDPVDMTSIGD